MPSPEPGSPGRVMMKTILLPALVAGAAMLSAAASHADTLAPFGAASAYNLVALGGTLADGTMSTGNVSTQAEVTGRIAAAGQVLNGTTVGSSLGADPFRSLAPFDLIATSGLAAGSQFNVNSAGDAYAPGTNGGINFNGGGHRVTAGGSGIDFQALKTGLTNQSNYLASLQTTGVVGAALQGANPSWLVLLGTSSTLNVFNLTAAQFASTSNSLDIEAPLGSTVVVNVAGTDVVLGTGLYYNGEQHAGDDTTDSRILFNFAGASSVRINGQFSASVLAPGAVLTSGAQMDGNFIVAEIGQTGEVHNTEFVGVLPNGDPATSAVPEPGTAVLLGSGVLGALVGTMWRRPESGDGNNMTAS